MSGAVQVTKAAVRRLLLERQGLSIPSQFQAKQPADVLIQIQSLECVQLDPVAAVERNQHLVLATRMPQYRPQMLERLLDQRHVFEYWANAACVIPIQDYPLFEVRRRHLREALRPELDGLGPIVQEVLRRLEMEGPLPSKTFQSADKVHGYWDNTHPKTKATSHALNLLHDIGQIQVVRRVGTTRYFDIRERAVPQHLLDAAAHIGHTEASMALMEKYMRAYRVFDANDSRFGWQRLSAADRRRAIAHYIEMGFVIPLDVEGVKRNYYILAEDAEQLMEYNQEDGDKARGARFAQFLPPLDNLLWRRDRIEDFFGFSYTWEIYTPASKRRFGYYTMPILVGEAIVGRIDPRLNRDTGTVDIRLLQLDPGVRWTKTLQTKVVRGLERFAKFHDASIGEIERTEPEGLSLG